MHLLLCVHTILVFFYTYDISLPTTVWFVRLSRPKEQEIRSLSYMYGPDHELSNLRSAYRHEHAQNPHYTW